MPRRTRPEPSLPPDVAVAVNAFGNASHVAILVHLASVDSAAKAEILEAVPMAAMTMHRHLLELEQLGLVAADQPEGGRQGRRVRYSLQPARTRELLTTLTRALLGEGASVVIDGVD